MSYRHHTPAERLDGARLAARVGTYAVACLYGVELSTVRVWCRREGVQFATRHSRRRKLERLGVPDRARRVIWREVSR